MNWTTELQGVSFNNSFLRTWSLQEGAHFARVRYFEENVIFLTFFASESIGEK